MFDELIQKNEMPIVIGVFVTPGVVKAPSDKALPRFNRSYEYDGLGDAYARFLLEELLPDVEKKTTADGRAIRLSKNGNDRAIGGTSSGAVCAFTAAWERPDAFAGSSAPSAPMSACGANVYPTLIRKYEPKPLRVFLQDGSERSEHLRRRLVDGQPGDGTRPDLCRLRGESRMGRGRPQRRARHQDFPRRHALAVEGLAGPIKAGRGLAQLQEILLPGEDWKLVADGYKFTEGPAVNAKGEVYFNDIPNSKTYKIGLDGQVTPFIADSKKGNGQAFGLDGRLYAVTGTQQVLAYDPSGKAEVIAEGINGNDIVVGHDGGVYVTHPNGGREPSLVWYISPKGEKKVVDTGLKFANGVTLSPDQSLLYVADYLSHWVYSYQVQPDGSLTNKQKYFHLHTPDTADDSGADGIRVDRDGRLWVATRMGLQVCDQAGRVNCIIPTPNGRIANLSFGGADFDIVFATCGDRVFQRKVKVKGANAFQEPIKPKAPRL